MNRVFVFLFLCLSATAAAGRSTYLRLDHTVIVLTDSAEAATTISRSDAYTKMLSPFEISLRMQDESKNKEKDYLAHAAKQVRTWSKTEITAIDDHLHEMADKIEQQQLDFNLPDTVRLLKSTTSEEFGAGGYTRGNFVVMNTDAGAPDLHLLAHELFHVYSRHNAEKKDAMYAIIGFKKCNPVSFNESIDGRKITNPDCPVIEHYITVPIGETEQPLAIILYSKEKEIKAASFQELLGAGLLALDGPDQEKEPRLEEGAGVIYSFEEAPAIFEQIGTNTGYIIHPEEITAEHFVLMLTGKEVPVQGYLDALRDAMKR